MSTARSISARLIMLVVALTPQASAGDLSPAPGAVMSTMKPLTDVEPRIAINADNTPGDADSIYRIAQSGSYYLTGNIEGAQGVAAIEIATDHVTIDLSGFALIGAPLSRAGIVNDGEVDHVRITNGSLTRWSGGGVRLDDGQGHRIDNLLVFNNVAAGILVNLRARVTDCQVTKNVSRGIVVGDESVIENCIADTEGGFPGDGIGLLTGDRCTVRDCASSTNLGNGIQLGDQCAIFNSIAENNGGDGINTGARCTIQSCTSSNNGGEGIRATEYCTLSHCTVTGNGALGIVCTIFSSITNCTVSENQETGVYVLSYCRVTDNAASRNNQIGGTSDGGIAAFSSNHIEGNTIIYNNQNGIHILGTSNLVVGNRAHDNGSDFTIPVGNSFGPIVDVCNIGDITSIPGADHPSANFVY